MLIATVLAIALVSPGLAFQIQEPLATQTIQMQQGQVNQPCLTTNSSKPAVQLTPQQEQNLEKRRERLQKYFPLQLPAFDEILRKRAAGTPCTPAPKVSPANPQPVLAQPLKMPPDTAITLKCNPIAPSKDGSHSTALIMPDSHAYEQPKQGMDFEADSVVPDLSAKTPCYLIRVDPKTNKSFISQ